jgi:hypothetical protein
MKRLHVGVSCPHCPAGHIVVAESMYISFEVAATR